jgi:acyl-CoA synthetase (AMP-forming)/AMP-acid ligase II
LPLRCIAVGGSIVPQSIMDKAAAADVEAVRVYASSEAPFSTATDPRQMGVTNDDSRPMPGVEVGVHGENDELIVRGPHQFHGYLDTAHNDGVFADDWIRTGDQADVEHGRIRIKGRLKELVVRKGMKISLSEIDCTAAGLGACAALAMPDQETGERLGLAIQGTDVDAVSYDTVVQHLAATELAKWKLPEQIVVLDGPLPRTASGKVNRRELADPGRHRRVLFAPA